jgi:hypothetical protein
MLKGCEENDVWQWREAEEPIIVSGFAGGAPGLWFSLSFLVVGIMTLLLASQPENWHPVDGGFGPTGLGLAFFGSILTGLGGWFLKTKWHIEELTPLPALCTLLGKNAAQVQRLAAERGVKPRYVVNGLEYYASSDFIDSASLLRASEAPEEKKETLLRPAGAGEVNSQELLRVPEEAATASAFRIVQSQQPEQDSVNDIRITTS